MKALIRTLAVVAFAAFVGCSEDGTAAFCDAVKALNTLDKKTATSDDVTRLIDNLVEAAPGEIEESTRRFGESIKSAMTGDFEAGADPDAVDAGRKVQTFTEENCGDG